MTHTSKHALGALYTLNYYANDSNPVLYDCYQYHDMELYKAYMNRYFDHSVGSSA